MDQEIMHAFSLEGRVAVLTGAASGIAQKAAVMLAQAGARVVLADVNEAGLAQTAEQVKSVGGTAFVRKTDVTRREDVNALASFAVDKAGRIDIWANAAGLILQKPIVEATEADFDKIFDVNLKGTYWGCAAAAKVMIAQGSGSIINLSSGGADAPAPGLSLYSMTKAAVNMLTRTLATEIGKNGVRVNTIAPGFIDTPMVSYRFQKPDGSIDTKLKDSIFQQRAQISVLGLTGEPSDVGYAMLYLASDASRFVTGQILRPNGGAAML